MKRRLMLSAGLLALVGCTQTPTPTGTAAPPAAPAPTNTLAGALPIAINVANLLAGENKAPGLLQIISLLDPTVIPPAKLPTYQGEAELAQTLLRTISTSTPPLDAATTLQEAEGEWNDALQLLVSVGPSNQALAPYVTQIDMAVIGIQLIETFINATLPAAPAPKAWSKTVQMRTAAHARGMTPEIAVAMLKARWHP